MKEDHQQAIKEKDAALAHRDNQTQATQYENVALQAQRDVYQAQLQKCQDQICDLIIVTFLVQMSQVKIILLWLLRKTPPPMKMSFMSIPTILWEYNDDLLTQKDDGLGHNIRIIDS